MGPLIPNLVIDPAWNNVIALMLGMSFGLVMESSGFSSARKIMGTFYGYDFIVLKVFFTAVVVCMVGLFYFDYLGIINFSQLYIHPTYLGSAIIGGVIMGAGFSMGGYCPGTSFCGVAIGKLDAIVFTAGLFIGILLFSELFPLYTSLYEGSYLGSPLVTESLGLSIPLFIFLFVILAIVMFAGATIIQKRVKKIQY
jgi:hypothetical protein